MGIRASLLKAFLGLFLPLLAISAIATEPPSNDVTAKIEMLGCPLEKRYPNGDSAFARNIWDMHVYKGKIYIGSGNYDNSGPIPNAGPVPIFYYDPAKKTFTQEFSVDDEQVDVFYTFSDGLYTPGADPKESWDMGNFYRLGKDGKWTKYRNIPKAIHTLAMAEFNGRLFTGNGAQDPKTICISQDAGATWKPVPGPAGRTYAFLCFPKKLYATGTFSTLQMPKELQKNQSPIWEYDPAKDEFAPSTEIGIQDIIPKQPKDGGFGQIRKTVNFGDKVIYLARLTPMMMFKDKEDAKKATPPVPKSSLYCASYTGKFHSDPIEIPAGTIPWDILVQDGSVFILLSDEEKKDDKTVIRVISSKNLKDWKELFHFSYKSFARSFERLDGQFYFGIGCRIKSTKEWSREEIPAETGNILRYKPIGSK